MADERTVILHGFVREDALKILKKIKGELENPHEIVFATSTPTNLEWKLKDIIEHTRNEHQQIKSGKRNPPVGAD